MTLQECNVMSGCHVRYRDWVPMARLRWNWQRGWEVSVDNGATWTTNTTVGALSPLTLFGDGWEVADGT